MEVYRRVAENDRETEKEVRRRFEAERKIGEIQRRRGMHYY